MKVEFSSQIIAGFAIAATLVSCGSSSQMASSFGSRKYTKGYFYNSSGSANTTAGTTKTTVAPAITRQTEIDPTATIAPKRAFTEEDKQKMLVQTENRKMTLKNAYALAKQKASVAASASQSVPAIAATEGTTKIETTANVQWWHHEGGWHAHFLILFIVLILLIIILISLADRAA